MIKYPVEQLEQLVKLQHAEHDSEQLVHSPEVLSKNSCSPQTVEMQLALKNV